jgi:hypothetical protein
MTVSMEAPHSGQASFKISKTVWRFWRTLYKPFILSMQF